MKSKVGAILLGAFLLAAIVGPWLAPYAPDAHDLDNILQAPSAAHWLGTDENGSDLFSMLLHGARLALFTAGATVAICMITGTLIGACAGYLGGIFDEVVMRIVDILLAFPGILLNLAIVALVQKPSLEFVVVALAINGWVGYARVARGQTLSVRERDYVTAARAAGAGLPRILVRHIIPSITGPLIVQATFGFGGVILVEASLSFLGLGPAIAYTWGSMLSQGTTYLWRSLHLAAVPGVAIAVVVLGANLLGDGLRDALDPRSRQR